MKTKRILTLILSMAMLLSVFAVTVHADDGYSFDWSGPCNTATKGTINVGPSLPSDMEITGYSIDICNIISGISVTYMGTDASQTKIDFTTNAYDEPKSGKFGVTLKTSNYGNVLVTVNVVLTGKYIVNISAFSEDKLYDGIAHDGYNSLKGTLTSGETYTGEYTYSYAKADGTALNEAPTEVGSYTVTIAVPDDNETYKGSKTLSFDIISEAEAVYQTEIDGDWKNGAFTKLLLKFIMAVR